MKLEALNHQAHFIHVFIEQTHIGHILCVRRCVRYHGGASQVKGLSWWHRW